MRNALLATAGVLVLAACSTPTGAGGPTSTGAAATQDTVVSTTSAPPRTGPVLPTYAPPSVDPEDARSVVDRCGVAAAGTLERWPVAGGTLEGMVLGGGSTVAVFLSQTDDVGMCGWAEYAAWAAGQGVRAVLWNRCGDGESACDERVSADPVAQTEVVVDWARAAGAERVVLVGASKGGGVALAAAQPVGADAVVDLSGSVDGAGGEFAPVSVAAARTHVPLLLAMAPSDQSEASMRSAFDASPASPKAFVVMPGGHGWDYVVDPGSSTEAARVSPFGERLLRWVRGDYS